MQLAQEKSYYVYDGDCPICADFAAGIRLRNILPNLEILNARENENHPAILEINNRKLNLDIGAVLIIGDEFLFGKDAAHFIANNGEISNLSSRFNRLLFSNHFSAKIFYPFVRFLRDLMIYFRGKGKIDNLR